LRKYAQTACTTFSLLDHALLFVTDTWQLLLLVALLLGARRSAGGLSSVLRAWSDSGGDHVDRGERGRVRGARRAVA
jgi:hypothetical protein